MISDEGLAVVSHISSILSIMGSLALILLLVAYQFGKRDEDPDERWKPIQREMLMSLSVCDLLTSVFYLIKPGHGNCVWTAPCITFFACSAFLWTVMHQKVLAY